MAGAFSKQSASRPIFYQVMQLATGASVVTTGKFGLATQQIRVLSQLPAWITINQTTSDSVIATSAGGVGIFTTGGSSSGVALYAGAFPEYFTVTPGQLLVAASTSTSSFAISVTEMC